MQAIFVALRKIFRHGVPMMDMQQSKTEAAIEHARQLIAAVGRKEAARRSGLNVRSLDEFHTDRWRPTTSTLRKLERALDNGEVAA